MRTKMNDNEDEDEDKDKDEDEEEAGEEIEASPMSTKAQVSLVEPFEESPSH